MMLADFIFLLLLTGVMSSEENCSYNDVLHHLNLTKNNELFFMTRPVTNHRTATEVYLDVLLYAILDMKEKEQMFVPYVWITKWWKNDHIKWDPKDFCGITSVSVPAEIMWKPDLTIEEMTEKDKAPPAPYLAITNNGNVELTNDQVLVSTCRMHTYKFPFDIQTCNLTFKSVIHSVEEINLNSYSNSSEVTKYSRDVMRTQSEWLFLGINVTSSLVNSFGFNQSTIVYTITMKRRSTLYIINFLLPILFFLTLDLVSFLISDRGGEKLSFKVTVLLAVTVMQLILNEILPSSSNRIPLIALYCIGVFGLMLLSLMETIVVMYLIEKDSSASNSETEQSLDGDGLGQHGRVDIPNCLKEVNPLIHCGVTSAKKQSKIQPEAKEGSDNKDSCSCSQKLSDELKEVLETLILILNSKKEEEKLGYWTLKTKIINKVFFIFYVIADALFLSYMFLCWNDEHH